MRTAGDISTIIATSSDDTSRIRQYIDSGCRVLQLPSNEGHIGLKALVTKLGEEGIDSIFAECGGTLVWSLFREGIVNKVYAYIAPRIFGGAKALTPVEGPGVDDPASSFILKNSRVRQFGPDFMIESEVDIGGSE